MTVLIVLTTAGLNTGPFNLYTNLDGYSSPFETGVSKSALIAGYTSIVVPDGTTMIRVQSAGECTNYIDLTLESTTTTTTTTTSSSTTTTTSSSTTTTTTTAAPTPEATLSYSYVGGSSDPSTVYGTFTFNLTGSTVPVNLVITDVEIGLYNSPTCSGIADLLDSPVGGSATITAGNTTSTVDGSQVTCTGQYVRNNTITLNGTSYTNGQQVTIGGVLITIAIEPGCDFMLCI